MGPRLNRPFTVVGVGAQHGIVELPPVLADRQNAAMRLDEVLAEPLEAWPSPLHGVPTISEPHPCS